MGKVQPLGFSLCTCEGKMIVSAPRPNLGGWPRSQDKASQGQGGLCQLRSPPPPERLVHSPWFTTGKQGFQLNRVGQRLEVTMGPASRATGYIGQQVPQWGQSLCPTPPEACLPWPALPRRATPAPRPQPLGPPLAGLPAVYTGSSMIGELGGRG